MNDNNNSDYSFDDFISKNSNKEKEEYLAKKNAQSKYGYTRHKKSGTKETRFLGLLTAFIVMLIIFIFLFASTVISDKVFSADENRNLAQKPDFSFATLLDGSYTEDIDTYLSDQFAGRGVMVRTKTLLEIMIGKKEENGVFIGKKGFLFEKPSEYQNQKVDKTISAINSFTKKYPKIKQTMMIVPNSSEILSTLMPKNAPNVNQTKQIEKIYSSLNKKIKTVDITTVLKSQKNTQSLYYRTDHHWTTTAANIAFNTLKKPMSINNSNIKYKTYALSNSFRGTLSSSAGIKNSKDIIYATIPENGSKYIVKYTEEQKKSASVFDSTKLKNKNQYEVFLGGNFSEIKIDTSLNSKKVLMIVKDSYANCLIPMLTPYYKSIIIIDPRYFNGEIKTVMKQESVSEVLWLYNANTFLDDTSISGVFE